VRDEVKSTRCDGERVGRFAFHCWVVMDLRSMGVWGMLYWNVVSEKRRRVLMLCFDWCVPVL